MMRTPVMLSPASLDDAASLLALRNDPEAIAMSTTGRAVTVEEHQAWLARVCAPYSGIQIYLGRLAPRLVVGSVRLETRDGAETISIVVDPQYRRQGVAWQMLDLLIAEFSPLNHRRLRAVVRRDNLASRCLFLKLGFTAALPSENPNGEWLEYRKCL